MIRSTIARGLAALASLALVSAPALAQTGDTINVLDGAGTSRTYGVAVVAGKRFNMVFGADANGAPYLLASQSSLESLRTGGMPIKCSSLDPTTLTCDANGNLQVTLASAGTPGAGAPTRSVQVGGSDGVNLRTFKTRTDGSLFTAGVQEGFQLATANAASAAQTLFGGDYVFAQLCTGYGTVALQVRGPDGATFITIASKTAADASAGTGFTFGSNAIVQVALTGTTGCNATLTRVP